MRVVELLVIGAGPYGLAVAARRHGAGNRHGGPGASDGLLDRPYARRDVSAFRDRLAFRCVRHRHF